jgi:xanthine dehydrogenase accessory factor
MWLGRLHEWAGLGVPCALATIVETKGATPRGPGSKMAVSATGEIAGSVGGGTVELRCIAEAKEVIESGSPRLLHFTLEGDHRSADSAPEDYGICGGTLSIFIEPVLPPMEVVAFGAGHVARSLASLCSALGMPFRVYDDRPSYPTQEHFPNAKETLLGSFDDLAGHIRLSAASHCVILTHGHAHDGKVLEQLLQIPSLPYIGMIGSPGKVQQTFAALERKGLRPDGRVFSPVGLALGGGLPSDIALSILAEIRLLQNSGSGKHLRLEPKAPT